MKDIKALLAEIEEERDLDYILARSQTTSDRQAIQEVGISSSAWYRRSEEERSHLNDIALELKRNRTIKAALVLDKAAEDAAQVIVDLLASDKDSIQLRAAQDILDRTAGKPTQKIEQTTTEIRRPTLTVDDVADLSAEVDEWEQARFGSDSPEPDAGADDAPATD